jgi:hypothetical protein
MNNNGGKQFTDFRALKDFKKMPYKDFVKPLILLATDPKKYADIAKAMSFVPTNASEIRQSSWLNLTLNTLKEVLEKAKYGVINNIYIGNFAFYDPPEVEIFREIFETNGFKIK